MIYSDEKNFKEYTRDIFEYNKSKMIKRKLNCGQTYTRTHAEQQNNTLNKHILPFFGDMEPKDITVATIDSWVLYLKDKKLSNSSISHYISTLNVIFKELLRADIVYRNPLDHIDSFSKKPKEKDILTREEIEKLFNFKTIDSVWNGDLFFFTACYLASKTGLRLGEVQGLQKDSVKEDEIIIKHSWARKYGLKGTKNGKIRNIPIQKNLYNLLQKVSEYSTSEYVFSLPGNTKPIEQKRLYKHLYKAFERIGINDEERRKRRLSFHNFRHTLNTRLIEAGTPLPIVQSITGHSDDKMSLHYFHPTADSCREYLLQI